MNIIFNKHVCARLKWYFIIVPIETVSSFSILSFLKVKLIQNFTIKGLIFMLLTQLYKANRHGKLFKGIKIGISGRFTRKERKLFW